MALAASSIPFARIHAAYVARVAAALGVGLDFVVPVANDDYELTEFENLFAFVRTYGPWPCDPTTGRPMDSGGAGRWQQYVGRRFRVYVYTRSGVDVVGSDTIALQGGDAEQTIETPPTMPGQFVLEEAVVSALHNWAPTYVDEESVTRPLTIGPVKWVNSADGPSVRKKEADDGIVRSHLDFEVVYTLALVKGEPSPALPTPPDPGT